MKRIISLFLTLCLLAACGLAGAESKATEGKPWVNSNMLDYITAERPAPEYSFDMYANYDAYREAKDNGITEVLLSLDESERTAREQIIDLCRSMTAECAEDEILRILYGLVTDTEKRNADGLAPLMTKVDRVKAVETTDGLLALMQEEGFLPCDTFFNTLLQNANDGSGRVVVSIDRAFLLNGDAEAAKAALLRMQYSEEEAAALAERMQEYDDYFPDESIEWPEGTILTIGQLKEKCPLMYAQIAGLELVKEGPVYEVNVPADAAAANHFFTAENLDILKAAIALKLYMFAADYLDEETWKAEGSWREDYDTDRNVYRVISAIFDIAVDQAYLKHFCPEESREMVVELLAELKDAMRERITQNAWMDEETKRRSLEKLETIEAAPFTATGGMFDCEPLKTELQSCTTLLDAAEVCQRYRRQCTLRYAGEPYTRGCRYMANGFDVMIGNGQYKPDLNLIVIGAPALNPPMCNTKSKATLLGSLGQHLGHELSHAFSVGCLVDVNGGPLYTEETEKTFMEKVNAMIARMDQIEVMDGVMLKGEVTISELMSDVTGVSLALDVAKKTEGFDYAEFFETYANAYRTMYPNREGLLRDSMSTNPHPASFIRVNYTVAQFEEFYEAFPSVKEGTPMYVAPEDRIVIW